MRNPFAFIHSAVLAGLVVCLSLPGPVAAESVEKTLFLTDEGDEPIAVNSATGQFFRFRLAAKESVERRIVAKAVIVLVTNQRFAGIGGMPTGWSDLRRSAGERLVSAEAEDQSAVLVTTDRVLSFNGRTGSWSETSR